MKKILTERLLKPLRSDTEDALRYWNTSRSLRPKMVSDPEDPTGILNFGVSDEGRRPYFSFEHIREAAKHAIDYPKKDIIYTPSNGMMEVREAIAEKCERENGFEVDPAKEIAII